MDMRERKNKGLAYICDDTLMEEQARCRRLIQEFNTMDMSDFKGLKTLAEKILGKCGENPFINPPFYCDYGTNIEAGKNLYINYNCTILDTCKVILGDNCFIAPNVSIYTAGHPVYPDTRNSLYEYGIEVVIGDNVWIGGNCVICPGVHIGSNTCVGAGSVVTKDIPDWSVAAGNPCRVIRKIIEADRRELYKGTKIDSEAWADIEGKRQA